MTREEAKRELRPIKELGAEIRSIEEEIMRLDSLATRMTQSYDATKISGTRKNAREDAIIKANEYRDKLSGLLLELVQYKTSCCEKLNQIDVPSLRAILRLYYFENNTMEKIAEKIDKTPRWTYELYLSALDEYAKQS